MSTIDVEARLEHLAAASADPQVPEALWARLAQMSATPAVAVKSRVSPAPLRLRSLGGGKSGRRTVTMLGLAATIALIGGVAFAAVGQITKTQPTPSGSIAPSVTLGPWSRVHTFSVAETGTYFVPDGSTGNGFSPLRWQDGRIVGLGVGLNSDNMQATCVLSSVDGSGWTCGELPKPDGFDFTALQSVSYVAAAVRGNHWVAVGGIGPSTALTWVSSDGITWQEVKSARLNGFSPDNVLATADGFVMTGMRVDPSEAWSDPASGPIGPQKLTADGGPVIWTSGDGTSWQAANVTGGSGSSADAGLAYDPVGGYLALGQCNVSAGWQLCAAHSADGKAWQAADLPAPVEWRGTFGLTPNVFQKVQPVLRDGDWLFDLILPDPAALRDPTWSRYSSADGLHWTVTQLPAPASYPLGAATYPDGRGVFKFGSWVSFASEGTTDDSSTSTYWSDLGRDWTRVSDLPPGTAIAAAITPTSVLVFMLSVGDAPTVTVWSAALS
jgi:hypothetical protein